MFLRYTYKNILFKRLYVSLLKYRLKKLKKKVLIISRDYYNKIMTEALK